MLHEYFKIDLIHLEKERQYCITDSLSGKIVAAFPVMALRQNIDAATLLETFKNIFHEPSTEGQGIFISYQTAKDRTLDTLSP